MRFPCVSDSVRRSLQLSPVACCARVLSVVLSSSPLHADRHTDCGARVSVAATAVSA